MSTQLIESPTSIEAPPTVTWLLTVSGAFGLVFASVTLIHEFVYVIGRDRRLYDQPQFFLPLFVLFVALSTVLYGAFAGTSAVVLRRATSIDASAFILGAGGALIIGWIFVLSRELLYYTPVYQRFRPLFISTFSLIAWRPLYVGLKRMRAISGFRLMLSFLGPPIPLLALSVTYGVWCMNFRSGEPISILRMVLGLALAVLLILSPILGRVSGRRLYPALLLGVVMPGALATAFVEPYVAGRKAWSISAATSASSTGRPIGKILLLTVDTLRADALGVYGSSLATSTPNLDALAADSVVFENGYSPAPWTVPSFCSIMTGVSPWVHRTDRLHDQLPDDFETLAETLSKAGYRTAALGMNPLLDPIRNLTQGFDDYEFYPRERPEASVATRFFNRLFPSFYLQRPNTEELATRASAWLAANSKNDFFYWLHFFDPHGPYEPPEAFRPKRRPPEGYTYSFAGLTESLVGKITNGIPAIKSLRGYDPTHDKAWIRELYLSEVRYMDHNVGRVIETLKEEGIYDDALIIMTSDHGEELWEHGLLGHGHTLYNELIRVPFMVKLPGSAVTGKRKPRVTTQSIMATVCDLLGITLPPGQIGPGSVAQLLGENPDVYEESPVFSTGLLYGENREAVISDQGKYIRNASRTTRELFDLASDPGEKADILEENSDLADSFDKLLDQKAKEAEKRRTDLNLEETTEAVELTPENLEELRKVGYFN